eukprot:COSAG06_NODE_54539_length_294_cov_0.682051_1_plen_68_part_01
MHAVLALQSRAGAVYEMQDLLRRAAAAGANGPAASPTSSPEPIPPSPEQQVRAPHGNSQDAAMLYIH